jgi:hypothetical protein
VTKLCGAQIFAGTTIARSLGSKGRARESSEAMVRADFFVSMSPDPFKPTLTAKAAPKKAPQIKPPKYLSIPLYAPTGELS